MRKISSIYIHKNYQIHVRFDNGMNKEFDLEPFLNLPVFTPLKNMHLFKQMKNHGYYIEWEGHEIDLSADTLWHEGKTV